MYYFYFVYIVMKFMMSVHQVCCDQQTNSISLLYVNRKHLAEIKQILYRFKLTNSHTSFLPKMNHAPAPLKLN